MQGDVLSYLSASGIAAVVNFPLWKAATIGQSGFSHAADGFWAKMRVLFDRRTRAWLPQCSA